MGKAESALQSLIRRAASSYTAGPVVGDAQTVCQRLASKGISNTVCYWDVYADQPASVFRAYVGLLNTMPAATSFQAARCRAGASPDCYLSIKAPALDFNFDLVKRVLVEASQVNAVVHFDAMGPETVDRTFLLIEKAADIYPKIGCTLPGRWRRSLSDADRVVRMGLRVRVVKGEWAGIGADDIDPREGFLNIVERLAGHAVHVAVATHNPIVARLSLRRLKNAGTPCELELLYGLPQKPMLRIARDLAVRARMYVPYGHSGLPYRLKNAFRNPKIIGWFLHDLWRSK